VKILSFLVILASILFFTLVAKNSTTPSATDVIPRGTTTGRKTFAARKPDAVALEIVVIVAVI